MANDNLDAKWFVHMIEEDGSLDDIFSILSEYDEQIKIAHQERTKTKLDCNPYCDTIRISLEMAYISGERSAIKRRLDNNA